MHQLCILKSNAITCIRRNQAKGNRNIEHTFPEKLTDVENYPKLKNGYNERSHIGE